MQEQFCSYAIALKLKELGFDEKCLGYYNNKELNYGFSGKLGYKYEVFTWKAKKEVVLAPLWQQAIGWLMREKGLFITFTCYAPESYKYSIHPTKNADYISRSFFDRHIYDNIEGYYYSREQAILKAIELCKNQ